MASLFRTVLVAAVSVGAYHVATTTDLGRMLAFAGEPAGAGKPVSQAAAVTGTDTVEMPTARAGALVARAYAAGLGSADDGPHHAQASRDLRATEVHLAQARGSHVPEASESRRAARPSAPAAGRTTDDGAKRRLAEAIQRELRRVECYHGEIDGAWGPATRRSMQAFNDRVNARLPTDEPDYILLTLLQGHSARACGAECPAGQVLAKGACVPRSVVAEALRQAAPTSGPAREPAAASVAPISTAALASTHVVSPGRAVITPASERAGPVHVSNTSRAAVAAEAAAAERARLESERARIAAAEERKRQRAAELRAQAEAEREARLVAAEKARVAAEQRRTQLASRVQAAPAPRATAGEPAEPVRLPAAAAPSARAAPAAGTNGIAVAPPQASARPPQRAARQTGRAPRREARLAVRPVPPPTYRLGRTPVVAYAPRATFAAASRGRRGPQAIFRELQHLSP